MITIEEAANKSDNEFNDSLTSKEMDELSQSDNYKLGFKAGVEFAQRWIPVEEELPRDAALEELFIVKGLIGSIDKTIFISIASFRNNIGKFTCEGDWKYVTHWRPINIK